MTVMVFSALWLLCSHVCSMFYCLIGNALLIYYVIVNFFEIAHIITVSINRNTLTNYNKATKHVTSNTHHYIP